MRRFEGYRLSDDPCGPKSLAERCKALRLRIGKKRQAILGVLDGIDGHPDALEIYKRVCAIDPSISIATVYRTLGLLSDANLISRRVFGDGTVRYEDAPKAPHAHIVDQATGHIMEFESEELLQRLQKIAAQAGYRLVDYNLELFGVPQEHKATAAV